MYVAQNGGRITRALLEIALSERWAGVSAVLMGISKAIEKRIWPFQNPLCQFSLSQDLLHNLQKWADDFSPAELLLKPANELGELVHLNERHGTALQRAVKQFPSAEIKFRARPLNSELVRLDVVITALFNWERRVHGFGEPFWLWVEDMDSLDILQLERLLFRQDVTTLTSQLHVSVSHNSPQPKVRLRLVSDKWLGAESEIDIPLIDIKMPFPSLLRRPLLDLPLLSTSALLPKLSRNVAQKFIVFNATQTQAFWPVVNSRQSVIFSGPAGCGKSTLGYISLV